MQIPKRTQQQLAQRTAGAPIRTEARVEALPMADVIGTTSKPHQTTFASAINEIGKLVKDRDDQARRLQEKLAEQEYDLSEKLMDEKSRVFEEEVVTEMGKEYYAGKLHEGNIDVRISEYGRRYRNLTNQFVETYGERGKMQIDVFKERTLGNINNKFNEIRVERVKNESTIIALDEKSEQFNFGYNLSLIHI
mgnify:CR=1 FL=1